ncbi:MAG: hypothetical protein ABEI96_08640 [Haloarculaceae archaeon]
MVGVVESIRRQNSTRQAILGIWAISGILVLLSFFLPASVGRALTGRGVITTAMTFIGSGLVFLALLPVHPEQASGRGG